MSDRSPKSWRSAQLSAEELEAQRAARRERRSKNDQPVEPSELERAQDQAELSDDSPESPWRALKASRASREGEPSSWREARLSDEEVTLRDEERALRAGRRAEERAERRERATRDWERSSARRGGHKAAQDQEREEGESSAQGEPEPRRAQRSKKRARSAPQRESVTEQGKQQGKEQGKEQARGKRGRRRRPAVDGEWLKQAGLRYLGRFAASEAQFRRVMSRKIKSAEERVSEDPAEHLRWVDEAVEYAKLYGGINDEQLSRSLLNSMRRQGLSTAMIRQKLRQKGLSAEQVKLAFEEREEERDPQLDQLASAARAARKRRLGPWGPSGLDYPARQKQLAALARRGFSFGIAKRVLEAPLEQAEEWAESLS